MDASHLIERYFEIMLDILGEVRSLRLVQQPYQAAPDGHSERERGLATKRAIFITSVMSRTTTL